jgi:predicted CXXCH cytochrome family protein
MVPSSIDATTLGSRALFSAALAVAALIAAFGGAATALADNGPHVSTANNGFTGITADSCAGCHRAHTAQGPQLINATDETALCLTCHGASVAGATTSVETGLLAGTNNGLLGGGFTSATMDTDWSGAAVSLPATSTHMNMGQGDGTMWGSGAIGSGAGSSFDLTCTSCHNPHGSGTYRILRPIPIGAPATAGVFVPDQTTPVYTVSSPLNRYFGQVYAGGDLAAQNSLDQWCSTCHTRYDAVGPGAGHTSSGDPIFDYRHTTRYTGFINCQLCHDPNDFSAPDPLDVNGAIAHRPLCENCHVAHGSSAVMGQFSGAVAWPDGSTTPSGDARSSLLRLDNRGVCAGCHDPTH